MKLAPESAVEARHEIGRRRWAELEQSGGIWPPLGFVDPSLYWTAMGTYDPTDLQNVLLTSLPSELHDKAGQAWPWVAQAIYEYEMDYLHAEWLGAPTETATKLIGRINSLTKRLAKLLYDARRMSLMSPAVIGDESLAALIEIGYCEYQHDLKRGLEQLALVCDKAGAIGIRRRGQEDKHLRGLVCKLAEFWETATRPETANKQPPNWDNGDGSEAPFVRLVNGLLKVAERQTVPENQIGTALTNGGVPTED